MDVSALLRLKLAAAPGPQDLDPGGIRTILAAAAAAAAMEASASASTSAAASGTTP